jgi:hypothetical protein
MNANADVIARVRKILARTEEAGCTAAEAEAAYGLASSLMAKHNLDMEEIEQAAGLDGEGWTEAEFHEAGRACSVVGMVAYVCNKFFFVEHYFDYYRDASGRNRVSYKFFGSPTNVETAKFIFVSLLSAIDRLWKDAYHRGRYDRTDRRIFALGIINGYTEKLTAERAAMAKKCDQESGRPGTALALQSIKDKTLAAFETAQPDLVTSRSPTFRGSKEAHEAGHEAGRKLNLSRPLGGSGGPLGLPDRTGG